MLTRCGEVMCSVLWFGLICSYWTEFSLAPSDRLSPSLQVSYQPPSPGFQTSSRSERLLSLTCNVCLTRLAHHDQRLGGLLAVQHHLHDVLSRNRITALPRQQALCGTADNKKGLIRENIVFH